jgi:hypothetical protein
MYKKAIVFFSLFALVGCNSAGSVDTQVSMLTDQISGCLFDAVGQKGGSVVIKNQPQYSNFERELNALGEASELCESGVEMPEVAFGDAVFVAKNMTQVCVLDVVVETAEEDDVYRVMITEDTSSYEGQECETYTDGAVAFALEGVPSGASIVVE